MNAPDLYIPLMSLITYALLVGLRKGMESGFTPEVLIQTVSRCLMLQIFEVIVIKSGLRLMQVPLSFLDVFSYTGYKYVGLCLDTLARCLGRTAGFVIALYTSFALALFILKAMAAVVPAATTFGPPRHLMLLGFAAFQFSVPLILHSL